MTETSTRTDQETIHAVRSGELDRFRELIERYEGQVYAVAWSRLGDASLAEEVVQESFIKAYRYLGWLRDPSRFGAWLTRIARGLAINFGIRHRRELNRRERWALDPSRLASHDGTPPEPSAVSDGALREALADLSATHRECLVLHYLEGHSIQDAAQALGITGGAFKVRLHRARAALRESIEAHLGESLGRLGPRTSQVSAIMAALPGVGSAGAGTGLIASLGAAVAKLIPAPWIALVLPMISAAFGVGAAAWMMSAERRNYRKPSDFRARLHQRATVRALIITALLMLFITAGGVAWVDPIRPLHILLAVGMALWLAGLRLLQLNRRPEMVAQALSALPMWIVLLVGQFVPVPPWWLPMAQLLFFGAMAFSFRARPLRNPTTTSFSAGRSGCFRRFRRPLPATPDDRRDHGVRTSPRLQLVGQFVSPSIDFLHLWPDARGLLALADGLAVHSPARLTTDPSAPTVRSPATWERAIVPPSRDSWDPPPMPRKLWNPR